MECNDRSTTIRHIYARTKCFHRCENCCANVPRCIIVWDFASSVRNWNTNGFVCGKTPKLCSVRLTASPFFTGCLEGSLSDIVAANFVTCLVNSQRFSYCASRIKHTKTGDDVDQRLHLLLRATCGSGPGGYCERIESPRLCLWLAPISHAC